MTRLIAKLVMLLPAVGVLCEYQRIDNGVRKPRSLLFPGPVSIVQGIMGAGFPVDLQDESVIIGVVIKAFYLLPVNSSLFTTPSIFYARRKRALESGNSESNKNGINISRWDVYKILEKYAQVYGYGGKECLLRTICELAETPIDKSHGIMEEILHVLFRPTMTREATTEHSDYDYYAAQILGAKAQGQCAKYYRDCHKSYVDLFTVEKYPY